MGMLAEASKIIQHLFVCVVNRDSRWRTQYIVGIAVDIAIQSGSLFHYLLLGQMFQSFSDGERAELRTIVLDVLGNGLGICPGILAEGPADRFSQKEFGALKGRAEAVVEEREVGFRFEVELGENGAAAQPDIVISGPFAEDRRHLLRRFAQDVA